MGGWIGHSEQVMEDNYLDSLDEDFLDAAGQIAHAKSHAVGIKN